MTHHSWRSVLYVPGDNARALDKARTLPADAIVFDLEDGVAPAQKANARAALVRALKFGGYGNRALLVRINPPRESWGREDLDALSEIAPSALVLPKVTSAREVRDLAGRLALMPGTASSGIWPMIERPAAVARAFEIAQAPRVAGLMVGTNDLAGELRCDLSGGRWPLMMALQTCVAAARSNDIPVIDGVFNAVSDTDGVRAECREGRALGMDGKSLIHPSQIEVANEAFAPSEDEVALARRRIAAFEAAESKGRGVALLDGEILEGLHAKAARGVLARDAAARGRAR